VSLYLGVAAVLLAFVASGIVSYVNTRSLSENTAQVTHTHEVLSAIGELLSLLKDAETGQRGYIITGDARYLTPHTEASAAMEQRLTELVQLIRDSPDQMARVGALRREVATKLSELDETIRLRRSKGFEAAYAVVTTDRGKATMDSIRNLAAAMQADERSRRSARIAEMNVAYRVAIGGALLATVLGVLLSAIVGYLLRRAMIIRHRQDWLQSGQLGLSAALAGDQRIEQVGDHALQFLAGYLDAQAGAAFALEADGLRRIAVYGVPTADAVPVRIDPGDGLVGQAVRDQRTLVAREIPDGYLTFGSSLGKAKPRHLLITPADTDGAVKGVIELGFLQPPRPLTIELLESVAETLAISLKSANYRAQLQRLLEETQRQAEELQAQSEELRVSNEELEEQGRALRDSQERLERQQADLEESNAQLEEQTALLESQRDELLRAKDVLQTQANELEQASRYKSDFLANMSHELRTPLNSSLILAKLLADNPAGNLTDEQVQYAETIQAAGNDLLRLINDILDLSKIEAGRMEMRPETIAVSRLLDELRRIFEPVVGQKKLTLRIQLAPGCPETLYTDRQRLEQVLKNLLSNAVKFTEQGEVTLDASRAADGAIAFAVIDTGIGIPQEQQEAVFDAFRQGDGTSNRKYGGTGLGLSIARELTKLLGGDIHLASEPGRGCKFTVTIPEQFVAPPPAPPRATPESPGNTRSLERQHPAVTAPARRPDPAPRQAMPPPQDDRERLSGNRRVILIVEDDPPFGRILRDLSHELGFDCLIATTAEEALAVAREFLPSAVILDIGLPDHSGLSVLDRLKHDQRTRHILVHVVTAGDYAETALSLGAVGFMPKPVKRDDLIDALKRLESRLDRQMRTVLVVEDDAVQRESVRKLLGSAEVETEGVGTAAECLTRLKQATYDCMVLDLSLPDASGYSLLETLSREDGYAFPPVIVYTGRDLSADEEQRLRRYSKSIIIKGAKSPERLLDEVTLFLHQVVSKLPAEQRRMLELARSRDAALEGRRILVVEDDVRNVFSLTSILEPRGATVQIARNGQEAIDALERAAGDPDRRIDLVLMDVMMPEMDGLTATRLIRKRPAWAKLPIIMLTAKAMKDDQARCLDAGANDYVAKPLDVDKLLSLIRVWMPR
jgi:CheY-like chemotaxis protein/CHASE3 domain sensor protein